MAIEGTAEVVEDEAVVWDVCVNIFERYNGEYSEEMKPFVEFMAHNRAAIRLDPSGTVVGPPQARPAGHGARRLHRPFVEVARVGGPWRGFGASWRLGTHSRRAG